MNKEQELFLYACERFENGEYDKALEAFVLAYSKGYEQELILKNIYDCYMAGNEEEFRQFYEQWEFGKQVSYEECVLDFVPYRDGEYFIYDKEKAVFLGVFSVIALQEAEPDVAFRDIEFSAAALAVEWDWREELSVLTTAKERKVYMVCRDLSRGLSFGKIPELKDYLKQIKIFGGFDEIQRYFHENTSVYLPMAIFGNEEEIKELIRIRTEEHEYRLTPQGRNLQNVLLTIAIPTAHRGNLVLKRLENLLQMPYDAEIEIVVSKNGNELYEEEYQRVSKIKDARLHYYDFGRLLEKCYYNWHHVVEMASGKYVLITSDEDEVFLDALEHYLSILATNPDLCLVRPRSTALYPNITQRRYGKKGWEAFELIFLCQNHFPGMIVRKKDFLAANLLSLEKYADNFYYKYYPHEWWWLKLSQYGDCMWEPVLLNDDAHPVNIREEWNQLGLDAAHVPGWKTYESRIEQFKGQVEFLQSVIKIQDSDRFELYLKRAIGKSVLLFQILRKSDFEPDKFLNMIDQLVFVCIQVIEESFCNNSQKKELLTFLRNCYAELFYLHETMKKKDF